MTSPSKAGFFPRQALAIPSSPLILGWTLTVPWPQDMNGREKEFLR